MLLDFSFILSNRLSFIKSQPFYITTAFILLGIFIAILLYPIETLIHELGHALAHGLSYFWHKFIKRNTVDTKLNIKISWYLHIYSFVKSKEYGNTTSDFRLYIENKNQYLKTHQFIARNGYLLGLFLYILIFLLLLWKIKVCNLSITLFGLIFFFWLANIMNYFTGLKDETSDISTVSNLKGKIKMLKTYKKLIKENTKLKKQKLDLEQKELLKKLNNSEFNSVNIQNEIEKLEKDNQSLKEQNK